MQTLMETALKMLFVLCICLSAGNFADTYAQSRKTVSVAEVTGTFRQPFKGKFKGSYNEIRIRSIGKGKLKVAFDLTYPFIDGTGGLMANTGEAVGTADIDGDTAEFVSGDDGQCSITIKFLRPGLIKVTQNGDSTGCGFGLNVSADGSYKKVNSARPSFDK